ncbi:amino acid transporter [Rhizodiscina lignyota]|uniref:Amino acid transporter n=1 Tax=Rhizodiscina lignyota TaxID=1504668 RepID=A0A9P4IAG9_9PEZI|nr:amino acid transporter [Rhizodiscina lignyota]
MEEDNDGSSHELHPLRLASLGSRSSDSFEKSPRQSEEDATSPRVISDRNVENDVLPETAAQGRNLGWYSAYIIIMSSVIGSGIFATPGTIVNSVGSIGLSLVLWVLGAIVSWAGLAVYLEYGCMLPRSGGDKVYLEFTYRRPRFFASTVFAVVAVLMGFTASNCIIFGEYVDFALSTEAHPALRKWLSVGLLTAVTIMHGCFYKAGILVQNTVGWMKVGSIALMVLASFFVVLFGSHQDSTTTSPSDKSSWSILWQGSNWNWGVVSMGFLEVLYTYGGLETVNSVMNEVKDPVKTLKSAAPAALVSIAVLYILINVAIFSVVPIDEIKRDAELAGALFFERTFGSTVGKVFLPLMVAFSASGNVMVATFALGRLNQEIARQGFLPFGRILASNRPFNAPLAALIVHLIPSILVITIPSGNVYKFILDVQGYPFQILTVAISGGLILLRFKRPDLARPYRAWIPAVWFKIALSFAFLVAPLVPRESKDGESWISQISYALVGIAIFAFAVLYWYVWTILLPRIKGYELEEIVEMLEDGTTISKLVKVPKRVK